ncbi:MAG: hypothetical protein WCH46_07695 [bacterium]
MTVQFIQRIGSSIRASISKVLFIVTLTCSALSAQQGVEALSGKKEYSFVTISGSSECQPIILKNISDHKITITSLNAANWNDQFELTDAINFPYRLAPHESIRLGYVCFRPSARDKESEVSLNVGINNDKSKDVRLRFRGSSHSESSLPSIAATLRGAVFDLNPNDTTPAKLISIVGSDNQFNRVFSFKNTTKSTITISKASFETDDQRFEVAGLSDDLSFPFELAPEEVFTLRISYTTFERKPLTNTLLIWTNVRSKPVQYNVRGLQLPTSALEWNKK